jgi:hypothetical protein
MPPPSTAPPVPYARIGDEGQHFNGPRTPDLPPGQVSVVLFGPQASRVAQSAEVKAQLAPAGKKPTEWNLIPIDSDQSWGAASTQLVHALMDEHALAIVALDRNAAHLSEQLALKAFVPVIALSGDKSLTSANVPWIFRLPAASTPADALHLVRTAAARAGVNPKQVRDALASGVPLDGLAFLPTGELRGQ